MYRFCLMCCFFLSLLFLASGCSKAPPEAYVYSILVDSKKESERKMFQDAVLFRGDSPLGTMTTRPGATYPSVVARIPASEWLSGSKLAFRFSTPCGPGDAIEVNLNLSREREEEARKYYGTDCSEFSTCPDRPITAFVTVGRVKLPKATKIWVDLNGKSHRVAIGKLEKQLDSKTIPWIVYGMDCAPRHRVGVDGKTIGEITPDTKLVRVKRVLAQSAAAGSENYFISTLPDACYRWSLVVYKKKGEFGGSPEPVVFGGLPVVRLEGAPTYFLEKHPQIIKARAADEGIFGVFAYELLRVDCSNK